MTVLIKPKEVTLKTEESANLLLDLPSVRGQYQMQAPLKHLTTLGIGGVAEVLFTPADVHDLATFWRCRPSNMPITLLGEGSNVLIRDGGIPGVTIRIGPGCDRVSISGNTLYCEAGASTGRVARAARNSGLAGAAFLCGIPGSMGGALVMNAGCYGDELCQKLTNVDVIDESGKLHLKPPEFFNFSYRNSCLPENWIFAAAHLALEPAQKQEIRAHMQDINKKRRTSQPLKWPNAGSWFKNPPGQKAWQLIDEAECRGLRRGDAQVSQKHSNFFINLGEATAAEMEDLAEDVRQKVLEITGIELVNEVRLLGDRERVF